MSKAAVRAIKFFEAVTNSGLRGKITHSFLTGVMKLIHPRKKVIDDNLKLIYPESSEKWRKEIRSQVYENITWTVTELLALQHDASKAFDWIKKVHNQEIADELIAKNQGAIFLSGHFGNWELLSSWYAQYSRKREHDFCIVSQELHDKDVSRYLHELRGKLKVDLISKNTSTLKFVKLLKSGLHIALLNDISGNGDVIVPFMGHDATNMPGPAVMSMLSGAPIIPVCIYRNAPFEHEIEFFPPVQMPDKSLNHEERMRALVLDCNKAIEKFIRKRPELWFWLHKRWRPKKK